MYVSVCFYLYVCVYVCVHMCVFMCVCVCASNVVELRVKSSFGDDDA